MQEKLKGYEVVGALLVAYMQQTEQEAVSLKDRRKLYESVYDLCREKPDDIFDFDFCRRSGYLTSPDVDLVIRNLEDSKMLQCLNPDLVDFQCTDVLVREYEDNLKPRLTEKGLLSLFEASARKLVPSS